MSGPGNQPPTWEHIDRYLLDAMPVFDLNGVKIGDVTMHSTAAGYLMVGSSAYCDTNLYLPFRLIRSITPDMIGLSATKDALVANYTEPPAIHTVVETRVVPGTGGQMVARRYDVQVVQSGYDAYPAAVGAVDVGAVAQQLAVGMVVYDASGERLGEVTQYDIPRGLLVIERSVAKPRVLLVPFSAIKTVDRDTLTVYLSLPKDVLVKEHAMLPGDTEHAP